MFSLTLIRRCSLFLGLVLLLMLAVSLMPGSASAAVVPCYGDPTLYLSDGTSLTITVYIETSPAYIKSVDYTVRVPHGVTVIGVTWDGDPDLVSKESLKVKDNADENQYLTDTVVHTTDKPVNVTATSQMGSMSQTVNGISGEHLRATLQAP